MLLALEFASCESTLPILEQSDAVLLSQYAQTRNPSLFSELARRYTGSVYGTCLRITASVHDAEEVTQDCFFELAKQATSIHTSVAGWLHRMATNRSLNLIRSKKRRQKHEVAADTEVSAATSPEVTDPTWSDVAPILDEVINSLPEQLREPVVQHYLNGDSQSHIASQLDLNQSTVSRRINQGLEMLRSQLQKRGVTLGLSSLLLLMSQNSAQASPQLVGSVSKIGLLAGGGKAIGSTAITKLVAWMKLSALFSAPVFMQVALGGWSILTTGLMFLYIVVYKPDWFIQQIVAFGGRVEDFTDFPVLERWTWKTPPLNARRVMRQGFAVSFVCLLMASLFLFTDSSVMRIAGAAGPLVMGLWRFAISIRIKRRLSQIPSSTVEEPKEEFDPITLVDLFQVVGVLISMLVYAAWSVFMAAATQQHFFFWFSVLMCLGIPWGLYELVYKYTIYLKDRQKSPKPITEEMAQASAATAKTHLGIASLMLGGAVFWILLTHLLSGLAGIASDALPFIGVAGGMSVYLLSMTLKPISTLWATTQYKRTAKTMTGIWIACGVATVFSVAYWAVLCFQYIA